MISINLNKNNYESSNIRYYFDNKNIFLYDNFNKIMIFLFHINHIAWFPSKQKNTIKIHYLNK